MRKQDRMAQALEALKSHQDRGPCFAIHGTSVLGETNTRVLLKNGFLENILKGWYIPSTPAHVGTTVSWYACFWGFIAAYCDARFGRNWTLTPEESLLIWSGEGVIPNQVIVQVAKGSNTVQPLKHNTSIFNFSTRIPKRIVRETAYGLNIYPLAAALLRCTPEFMTNNVEVSCACLNALGTDDDLSMALSEFGGEAYANRLIGALEEVGRLEVARFVRTIQKQLGRHLCPVNPFIRTPQSTRLPERSPLASRIRLMWRAMGKCIESLATKEIVAARRPVEDVLAEMDDGYVADSYHSLSIEGYHVTEGLIRRVRDGEWNPKENADDENLRSALAASGYYRAYRKVRNAVERILHGEGAGAVIASEMEGWHRELFMPYVDAGLLKGNDLRGYRRTQVFIAGSRYMPPAAVQVTDAMEAYLDLVRTEDNPLVLAILGHFFFVYIHPYTDGNGRTARFIMNAVLAASGLKWKVISVDRREEYMDSLERASVDGDVRDFAQFIMGIN